MRAEFVTEVSSEQPLVIIVGSPSVLVRQIESLFHEQAISTHALLPDSVAATLPGISQKNAIYKCIWVHDPTKPLDSTSLQTIAAQLSALQAPIIQVVPIITPIDHLSSQNSAFSAWHQQSTAQNKNILAINAVLPEAQFVCLQDVVLEHHYQPWHALYFCTTQATNGRLHDPEIELSLLSPDSYTSVLAQQLLRPSGSGSCLIQGASTDSTQVLRQVQALYKSYHGVTPQLVVEPVTTAAALPFSVISLEIPIAIDSILSSWVRLLQPPQAADQQETAHLETTGLPYSPALLPKPVAQSPEPKPKAIPVTAPTPPVQPVNSTTAVSPPPSAPQPNAAAQPTALQRPLSRRNVRQTDEANPFDVTDELQRIFKPTRAKQKVTRIVSTAKKQDTIKKKSKRRTGFFYGGLGIIGLGLGVLVLAAVFFATQFLAKRQVAIALREAVEQQSLTEQTQSRLQTLNSILGVQLDAYSTVFDSVLLVQAVSLSELSTELLEVTENLNQARENTISFTLLTLGKDTGDGGEYAQKLALSAQQAYENLSLIQARMEQVELPIGAEEVDAVFLEFTNQIQALRQMLAVEQQLHALLPTLFGENSRKTYALVFQNDQELRPTGGFIEAVALLRFENGSLISTDVYSSYELDKQLVGTVAPPEEIRQFLAEDRWYLRDSNWDPHFPATAKKIAWFISKSIGTDVDGVIAINTVTAANLIEALGPIDIPQYNETLTHRNLAERMEFHSEVVLVDDSTTEFYPKLILSNLVAKLTSVQPEKVTALLSVFYQAFQTQEASLALFDPTAHETISTLGWAGEVINPACPSQISSGNCVVDELAQVEANVGVNKANYYLNRSITHQVTMHADQAEHKRVIQYQNTAQSNAWPKGAYRGYIRFYLPHDSQVSKVTFGGAEVAAEQLVQRQELGRPVLGVLIEVPTQQTKSLEITFTTPLPAENKYAYAFFDQQQSGISDLSHAVTFVPRPDQQPIVIAPQADVTPTSIIFSEVNSEHSFVGARFE